MAQKALISRRPGSAGILPGGGKSFEGKPEATAAFGSWLDAPRETALPILMVKDVWTLILGGMDFSRIARYETVLNAVKHSRKTLKSGQPVLPDFAVSIHNRPLFIAEMKKTHAHDLISKGLPGAWLVDLVEKSDVISTDDLLPALGISMRTYQRKKAPEQRDEPLTAEQGEKLWKYVEILERATALLGGKAEAETWLSTPATALDGRAPLELLSTQVGAEEVDRLLGRLEYGLYI
jgi:putative toxin-antitoxin system antitoxin component (TIGR02293 family)